MDLALKELLEQILQWNSPEAAEHSKINNSSFYSLEIDTLINMILTNLVNSDEAFGYGSKLA